MARRSNENRKGINVFHDICVESLKLIEPKSRVSLGNESQIIYKAFSVIKTYSKKWSDRNVANLTLILVAPTLCREEIGLCVKNSDETYSLSPKGEEYYNRFKANDPYVERDLYMLFYEFDQSRKSKPTKKQLLEEARRLAQEKEERKAYEEKAAAAIKTAEQLISNSEVKLDVTIGKNYTSYNLPDNARTRKLLSQLINPFEQ